MLFFLGYALALPVLFRFSRIAKAQNSLGLFGHQLGVIVAGIGWALRGRMIVVVVHVVWLIAAKIWFSMQKPRPEAGAAG